MATTLTSSDLSTRISSLWKGYAIRKIFSDLDAVNSWDDYDSLYNTFDKKIKENPSLAHLTPAWIAALDKTYLRLADIHNNCTCSWCIYYPDDGDTGLDWNESGYFD